MSATGEVYVNGARVTGETTLFVGDSLRTGADGVASLTISGRGMLIIAKQTEVSFAPSPRYFAELRHGSVGYRSLTDAKNFEFRVGNFTIVPVTDAEVAADIDRERDGATRVTCTKGSLGVISLEGPESIFLHPGEVARISPEGKLSTAAAQAEAVPPAGAPPAVPPLQGKRKHTGWIILGVAGGGAAAAAAALATRGGKAAASPSAP